MSEQAVGISLVLSYPRRPMDDLLKVSSLLEMTNKPRLIIYFI
jgi:hypothetical protein